jgi:Skp family chaperone for outer membrane proteins
MRYKLLKYSPDEQIRYAQKMAVKRVNAEQKKINDTYARNRRNERSAFLQEMKDYVE